MAHNNDGSQFPKTVYFRVSVNGKMKLVPMQVNAQGLLRYIGRSVERFHPELDSKSSALNDSNVD